MATWSWIVIIIVAVIIVAALAAVVTRQQRTKGLRQRFGPEYDRTVAGSENPRAAEAELRARQRERRQLDIKPLSAESQARYAGEWRAIQERFVDQPAEATDAADDLLYRVMQERGYPMRDFEAQSDLISVDHPQVVENYRKAHGVQTQARNQQASTEDLREALLRFRTLFSELLGQPGEPTRDDAVTHDDTQAPDDQAAREDASGRDDETVSARATSAPAAAETETHDDVR